MRIDHGSEPVPHEPHVTATLGSAKQWSDAEASGMVAVTLTCSTTDWSAAAAVDPMLQGLPITRSGVSFFMDEISLGSDLVGLGELGDEAQDSPVEHEKCDHVSTSLEASELVRIAATPPVYETAPRSSEGATLACTLGKPLARAHSQSEFARVELAEAQDLAEACRPDPASPTTPPATRTQKRARLGLSRASSQPREWWEHYLLVTS